ncbi:hypothetical protein CS022_19790 [Veronia nyctiphanis]|uniref:Uncharacterized protein n=1 Tax=Veronia nyctiphanis TaxID=1278244 RepID=A0A4Q0YRS1_9GAMM|nr:hypothetical protein CS022_19790 [Veronia nyctiphanis]
MFQHHSGPHQTFLPALSYLLSPSMRKQQLNRLRNAAKRFEQGLPVLTSRALELTSRGATALHRINAKVSSSSLLKKFKHIAKQ